MTHPTVCRALLVSSLVLGGCLSPTEIIVEVHTDVPCGSVGGVAITVGAPTDIETAAPTVVTHDCKDGLIGTLVAVPHTARDAALGIKATLSLGGDVETDCTAANGYKGCIVARRELHYLPQHSITVPIYLYEDCHDVACDAATTCDSTHQCVTAVLPTPACTGSTCTESDVTVDAGPGAPDASIVAGLDAAQPAGLDASAAGLDAAEPGHDAATPGLDAGRPDAASSNDGGCNSPCTTEGQQVCDPGNSGLIGTCVAVDGGACLELANLTYCPAAQFCIAGSGVCTCGDQDGPRCPLGETSCQGTARYLYTCANDGYGCPSWYATAATDCQGAQGTGVMVCNQLTASSAECDCPPLATTSQDERNLGCSTLDDQICVYNGGAPTVIAKCQLSTDACKAWLQTTDCNSPQSLVCDDTVPNAPKCVCPPHGSPESGCNNYGQDCEYYVDPLEAGSTPAPTGVNWPPACRFPTVSAALQALAGYPSRTSDHQVEIVITQPYYQTAGNVAAPWKPATDYYGGQAVSKPSFNGHNYRAQNSGTSGNAEPPWNTSSTPIADGSGSTAITWVMDSTPAVRVLLANETFPLALPFRTTLRGDCGGGCSERDSFVIQFNQSTSASAAVDLAGDLTQLNNLRVENLSGNAATPSVRCTASLPVTATVSSIALVGWTGTSTTQQLRGLEVDDQCSPNVTNAFINGFAEAGIYFDQATSSQTLNLDTVWLGPWLVASAGSAAADQTNLHGISGAGAGALLLTKSEVVGSVSDGILIQGAASTGPSVSIGSSRIEKNKGTGLDLDTATLSDFESNLVESNSDSGLRIWNLIYESGDLFIANVIRKNGAGVAQPEPQIDLGPGTEFWINGGPDAIYDTSFCQVLQGQPGGAPANQIYCYALGSVGIRSSGTQVVNIDHVLWDKPASAVNTPALNVDYAGSGFTGTDNSVSCATVQCQ